jgi:hypothetical protein
MCVLLGQLVTGQGAGGMCDTRLQDDKAETLDLGHD